VKQNHRQIGFGSIGFIDLSMNLMLGFACLFILLLAILRTEEIPTETNMISPGHLLIKVTWDSKQDIDIDTWIKSTDPKALISFKNPESGVMFLDQDDTGMASDAYTVINGKSDYIAVNQETSYIKYTGANRYTVNLHLYSYRDQPPVEVLVELVQTQPTYSVIHQIKVTLTEKGEQRTAFVFYTSSSGSVEEIITDVNENVVYTVFPE
jgi:hypothetical protein